MSGSLYNKIPLGRRKVFIRAWQLGACIGGAALIGVTLLMMSAP